MSSDDRYDDDPLIGETDPWADTTITGRKTKNDTVLQQKFTSNLDFGSNLALNSINIFGDSSESSMMDSMVGMVDPIGYSSNNNWGDYNSFNILSNNNNHTKNSTKSLSNDASTLKNFGNLTLKSSIESENKFLSTNDANYILTDNDAKQNDDQINSSDDQDIEEDESLNPIELKIWSDTEIGHFNPLNLKHAVDGLIVRVREIPEKQGLVFKHINYLISHTLKFSSEYYTSSDKTNNQNNKNQETKVIRRYSDFAWLVEVLWKKYPFRLIPELPPKKFTSSSNDVLFLQKRRRGLERFLYHLCKHPILSKENLVIMFLTVPNDFSNWKKFANIELNDEFDGIRINLPRRFKIDLSDVLKGLRDNESEYGDEENEQEINQIQEYNSNKLKSRDEFVNNINQIWNEDPTRFKNKEFISRINILNENLSKLAEIWSKLYLLVERIEKREIALSADHQRFAIFLDNMIKVDHEVFGMDNLISNKSRQVDDETQNMTVINSILGQICKYFIGSRKLKEEEMSVINNEILESWKKFQDYLISLHFLIERFFDYKVESEKEIQGLLQRIIKTNERIMQLKMKSDIRGSEIDRHINVLTTSIDQLSMLISRIILVKTTFANEYKLFQKTKYMICEVLQDWFEQRSKFSELKNDSIQRLLNELKDMPLGN